jgi:hypothetical protein
MKHKPTIAFGSEVCINAAKENYPAAEWKAVWKYVANNFRYAMIPLVLTEILLGIAHGDDAHFEENRKPLKILYPTHEKRFLDMPGSFAAQTVLRRQPKPNLTSPEVFTDQARVVIQAESKADLLSGRVHTRWNPKYSRGMDFSILSRQMVEGKKDHVESLEQLRTGALAVPPAEEWARLWMLSLGIAASPEECALVAAALDAGYLYECFLWNEAAVGQYKFAKHTSDWIDSQLLYYLCDPQIHLLVDDVQLIKRIAGSPQSSRVFPYTEFVSRVGNVPLAGVVKTAVASRP